MTASDPTRPAPAGTHEVHSGRGLGERALDLLVYAPAGVVVTALDDMPEMAQKGRARVDQELRNAKVVGRFAVELGLRQLRQQFEWLAGAPRAHEPAPAPSTSPTDADATAPARPARRRSGGAPTSSTRASAASSPRPAARALPVRDPAVDRAIPDYDVLAASQVVRRLDGLAPTELRAVLRHERAGRGRRTIVHRAEQLLGPHESPGTSGEERPGPRGTGQRP